MYEVKRQLWIVQHYIRPMFTMQLLFLALLTVQNTAAVMLMSYTQQHQPEDPSARFQVSHVVMMQEVTKVLASLLWCMLDVFLVIRAGGDDSANADSPLEDFKGGSADDSRFQSRSSDSRSQFEEQQPVLVRRSSLSSKEMCRVFKRLFMAELFNRGAVWMVVPAVLYVVQNYILFVALANLEPTLFQVTYQTKILGTALLMWMFLNRSFSMKQWMALVLLMLGVATAQIGSRQSSGKETKKDVIKGSYTIGLLATVCAVVFSSVSSVLVEAIFKSKLGASSAESHTSTKNVHLSVYSVMTLAIAHIYNNGGISLSVLQTYSFSEALQMYFRGFTPLVWVMVVVQAVGGLLVALVIRHSDNIMKAFATGCAIVFSGICSAYIYSFVPNWVFITGNILCLTAIVLYNR